MGSIGAAIRTAIVSDAAMSAVGTRVYRDYAPDGAQMPFVVFVEPLGDSEELKGDGKILYRQELVQVDLWQMMATEDLQLTANLQALLDGAALSTADVKVLRCRLYDAKTFHEDAYQAVRRNLTLRVTHSA